MGLDWNPLGKPRSGFEEEYYALLGRLTKREDWLQPSGIQHSVTPDGKDEETRRQRLFVVMVSPYETLGAPRVGRDPEAEVWIRSKYETASCRPATIDEWVERFLGYYVLDLVPDNDGLPIYSNAPLGGRWERWSFRAQLLEDCREVLGEALFLDAWSHHTPIRLAEYGARLLECARSYVEANEVRRVLHVRWFDQADIAAAEARTSPLHKADIIASAARWAVYWSSHGHGVEADY